MNLNQKFISLNTELVQISTQIAAIEHKTLRAGRITKNDYAQYDVLVKDHAVTREELFAVQEKMNERSNFWVNLFRKD